MTKLTNKAEFIDVTMDGLRIAGFSDPDERLEWAERIWNRLCKRGLAEEQREPGPHWVKWDDDSEWTMAKLNDGSWLGLGWHGTGMIPAIIGKRIEPPKD